MNLILLALLLLAIENVQCFLVHNYGGPVPFQLPTLLWSTEVEGGEEKYTTLPRLYLGPPPTEGGNAVAVAVASTLLTRDLRLELDSELAHYVTKVMRIDGKKKSLVRVFDGKSGEWLAQIQVTGTRNRVDVHATCLHQLQAQTSEAGPWVIFAPLKKTRVKQLLEKCTELGASRFVALQTDHTDPVASREFLASMDKLAAHIVEAAEQSERLTLPTLSSQIDVRAVDNGMLSLQDLLTCWEPGGVDNRHLMICRERSSTAMPVLEKLKDIQKVAFLIGPEGGWSADEDVLFRSQTSSDLIHMVSLGSSVLRAETAAMAAVAACALSCQ
jgi:16S rRNA (uracil1498-N3)-methyltransferase